MRVDVAVNGQPLGASVTLMSRPEDVRVRSLDAEGAGSGLPGTVVSEHFSGSSSMLRVRLDRVDRLVDVQLPPDVEQQGPAGRPRRGAPDAGQGAPRRLIVARRRLGRRDSLCGMCGIIGIVSRDPARPAPTAAELLGGLDARARRDR